MQSLLNTDGVLRIRTNPKIYMKPQKTPSTQRDFEKEQSGKYHSSWYQTILQNYNYQNSKILA